MTFFQGKKIILNQKMKFLWLFSVRSRPFALVYSSAQFEQTARAREVLLPVALIFALFSCLRSKIASKMPGTLYFRYKFSKQLIKIHNICKFKKILKVKTLKKLRFSSKSDLKCDQFFDSRDKLKAQ